MRLFEIKVTEKSTGKYTVNVLDTLGEPTLKGLTKTFEEKEADDLIDELNLVLKHKFNDYEPFIR